MLLSFALVLPLLNQLGIRLREDPPVYVAEKDIGGRPKRVCGLDVDRVRKFLVLGRNLYREQPLI